MCMPVSPTGGTISWLWQVSFVGFRNSSDVELFQLNVDFHILLIIAHLEGFDMFRSGL